ncbi:MAG: endonuclease/exonuclease/phosphatase family protein [Sediminibacterium sp.]|nr:endonuclease/exonuclease/phosphatase family protein [Sediminibacterium sp.]MBX9781442.1 endonuclease/exonuclease/phosphatase family protein [Chitinophagaceae bacterium]
MKKILSIITIVLAVCYIPACFSHYIHPKSWNGISYLALGFAVLQILLLIFILVTGFVSSKKWLLLLSLFLLGYENTKSSFAFHFPHTFKEQKHIQYLRVLSWNIDNFIFKAIWREKTWNERHELAIAFLKSTKADVLCLQDFTHLRLGNNHDNIAFIRDSLGYPYYYFSEDGKDYGTAIFSKIKIQDSGHIRFTDKQYAESIAYADIIFHNQNLRLFNTHLRSMLLGPKKIASNNIGYLDYMKEDTAFLLHSSRIERLAYFDKIHTLQANEIVQIFKKQKKPFVFCADLNSVPAGYPYALLAADTKDAFLEKGFGWGGTYSRILPTLRIDVVLTSPSVYTMQYNSPRLRLSDHYPIIADLSLEQ